MPLIALLLAVSPTSAPPVPEGGDGGVIAPDPSAGSIQPPALPALDAGSPTVTSPLPDAGPPTGPILVGGFLATPTDQPPRIDGKLDDPVWSQTQLYTNLTQQQPDPGARPTLVTEVRFAYDHQQLYVAVKAFDDRPDTITERLTRRDRQMESDYVTLEIDSRGDKKSAYIFGVYPSNVQFDALRTGDSAYDFDFDAVWRSATSRDADGWTAEFAIPFSILRFNEKDVNFRIELTRYTSRKGEADQLVLQPPDQQGALLRMAPLGGLHDLRSGHGLELRPFVLGRFAHRFSPGPDFDPPSGNAFSVGAGGDLAYHPSSEITLDATVLPDFGQVEADQVILNLSTFEVFFPEKRPFFLSGADLFALHDQLGNTTTTQLFYSRRVGRTPSTPVLDTGERLIEQPLTNDIWGAAKVTGRAGERLTLALLDAVSRRESATLQLADGSTASVPVSALSNFGVARLRYDVGAGFTVGATGAGVTRRDVGLERALGCPADENGDNLPALDGRCFADAYTGGLDATWSSPEGTWVAMAALLGSERRGGPDKALPDGTVIRSGDTGFGGLAQLAKAGGDTTFSLSYEGYSPKLDLNEAGYLRQQNLHLLNASTDYRTTRPTGPTLSTDTGIFGNFKESTDGYNLGRYAQLSENVRWKNFWSTYADIEGSVAYDDNRELRDGSIFERPRVYGAVLAGNSDSRKSLAFGGFLYVAKLRDGGALSTNVTFTLRPVPRLELSLTPQLDYSSGDPRWFDTTGAPDQPRTYHFGDLDARATSATVRGIYSFTPSLTLQAYAQLFVATGHYGPFWDASVGPGRAHVRLSDLTPVAAPPPESDPDFKDSNLNVNLLLRWEFLPGSVAYLVYTRAQAQGAESAGLGPNRPDFQALRHGPTDDVFLLKVSYFYGT